MSKSKIRKLLLEISSSETKTSEDTWSQNDANTNS
jgi:hypothetical protein